jgi:hypothetical protein
MRVICTMAEAWEKPTQWPLKSHPSLLELSWKVKMVVSKWRSQKVGIVNIVILLYIKLQIQATQLQFLHIRSILSSNF